MILLAGAPGDDPFDLVCAAVADAGADYVVFNQVHTDDWQLDYAVVEGVLEGELVGAAAKVDLADLDGIYLRLQDHTKAPTLADEDPAGARRRHWDELASALSILVEIAPGRVINRTGAITSNASKPYQAALIRQAGFAVPDTLVTSDPDAARAFAAEHRRVIYKSTSGIRSIVTELAPDDHARFETLRTCPVQFQELVEGDDVRVHTIGSDVIATAISHEATDYRYARRSTGTPAALRPTEIADDVAARCLRLADIAGLALAGIDLRISPDGLAYCFEINPSPAFSYYQQHSGQDIAEAVARYLSGGRSAG